MIINLHSASKIKEILSHIPLLIRFSLQSVSSFQNEYRKPIKNKVKSLLQENPLLNETVLYETDDPVIERIPQQNSKTFHELQTLLSEIRYQNFNDVHLSQDILSEITSSSSSVIKFNNTHAISQTPIKPTSTQSL